MGRDFTLSKYEDLLKQLPEGNYTLRGSLTNKKQFGIIRHDVDRPPKNVLKLAKLESDFKIQSTYYFRISRKHFIPDIITRVRLLGHEVGYHYEVLDKAKGNIELAIQLFRKEWSMFNEWDSKTICMHGNPLSKFVNKDIWKFYKLEDFGILGEGYLSIDFRKFKYFTDTGRKWNINHYSLKDKTDSDLILIKSTNDLIYLLKMNKLPHFYILTHPSKWNNNYLLWTIELLFQSTKNIIKYQLNKIRKPTNNI